MSEQFLTYLKLNKQITRSKRPPSRQALVLTTHPPADTVQKHYEQIASSWFNSTNHIWNWTINPNPRQTVNTSGYPKTISKLTNKQLYRYITREVKSLFSSKITFMTNVIEIILFFEYGDKNGKFHCNLCTLWNKDTDYKIQHYITDQLKNIFGNSNYAIKYTDHKKHFKKEDSYNNKDASFMSTCGYKPKHYINREYKYFTERINQT